MSGRKFTPMGLDAVEIVMEIEETFGITIEDAEVKKISTPGAVIELVLSKVGRGDSAVCLTQRAFHRLRAALMRQRGFKRNQLRPETPLAELFPRPSRKEQLKKILDDLGVKKELELVRPGWLEKVLLTGLVGGTVWVIAFAKFHRPLHFNPVLNFILSSPALAAVIYAGLFLVIFIPGTRGLRYEFSPPMKNLGQLARWVMANAPDAVQSPPGKWNREQVAEKVKEIVITQLGCEKTYREDAHFIEDLGMG